jgi:anti-sigma factor RsiW
MTEDRDKLEMLLCEYLDGQLSADQAAELERRLAEDPALREELRRYSALQRQLSALGEQDRDEAQFDAQRVSIMAAVERRALLRRQGGRRWIVLRPVLTGLAAAAAVVIIVDVAWRVWMPGGPREGTQIVSGPGLDRPPAVPRTPQPTVSVAVLPVAPQPTEEAEVRVECPRLAVMDLIPPTHPDVYPISDTPPGTVAVSVSPSGRTPTGSPMPLIFPLIE